MRVLWFTSGASIYTGKLAGSIGGGWVNTLEREIHSHPEVTLAISFLETTSGRQKFTHEGTFYYIMPRFARENKVLRWVRKWFNQVEDETHVISECLQVIEDFKPDIIHFFGSENPCGLVLSEISIPSILHIQGILTVCYHKYFTAFSRQEIRQAASLRDFVKRNAPFYHWKIYEKRVEREKKILSQCRHFFGRTDWDRRVTQVLSPGSKYFHCDEILRDSFYDTQWKPHFTDPFVLVSVFQDDIYKGLEVIFETTRLLYERGLSFEWKIIGLTADSPLLKIIYLHNIELPAGLPIRFLGKLQEADLARELMKARAFVHASHIENSSNSVSEAMLMGMPVVATAAGGLSSLITNQRNGYLIQDGDPWSLAGVILEIMQHDPGTVTMGQQARTDALERHDRKRIVDTVLQTYHELIEPLNARRNN